jgi:arylsulfatase A-like enzyme
MHSTDWFPTILDLASIDYKCDDCDGMSQKEALINGSESLKELMLYDCYVNIPGLTDIYTNATCAVRDKIYKLMHHFEDFKTDLTYDIDEIIDGDDNLNDATQCSTVDSYGKFNVCDL